MITRNANGQFVKGSANHRWNPDRGSYFVVHAWMRETYGTPSKCEHCGSTTAKRFDWANISGEYEKKRSDWVRLCRSCHLKMDYTDERKRKLVETVRRTHGADHHRRIGAKGLRTRYGS